MRLLIFGPGVIGSLYASLFAEAGFDTTVYARGARLETLKKKGLLYLKREKVTKANVSVLSELKDDDEYDFIFLTVRENQLYQALDELKTNNGKCIVTMTNSIDDYHEWENICGEGKILPAFPGAGGRIKDDVLDATLTPKIIQPTTFAEISGMRTDRVRHLSLIFKQSSIPYQIVKDMQIWQLCHLAMVVPIADAYYEADNPEKTGYEQKIMHKTAKALKRNLQFVRETCGKLSPWKMNIFLFVPLPILTFIMSFVYRSTFGEKFMYQHSINALDEMRELHKKFYEYMQNVTNITEAESML